MAPLCEALGDDLLAIVAAPCEHAADALLRTAPEGGVSATRTRLAVVRPAFLADGAQPPPLSHLLRYLGHNVVALRTEAVQRPHLACVVDEHVLCHDDATGSTVVAQLTARSTPLPVYLNSRGLTLRCVPEPSAARDVQSSAAQSSTSVLCVAPAAFESNAQAAVDNAFMAAGNSGDVADAALEEHAALHDALLRAGVQVYLFSHTHAHGTPDACFPNNWFQATPDGTLVLYPMKNPNRQAERRKDIIAFLASRPGRKRTLDFTAEERATQPRYLEGTGSLVYDHLRRVAYLARSERSDEALARAVLDALGYRLVAFDACDAAGRPIYHTNVVMAVGTGFAVVCDEAVMDSQRAGLLTELANDRDVVRITREQMGAFCGNVLELRDGRGLPVLALSTRAFEAFTQQQRATLLGHVAELVHVPLSTLEAVGGGGVRCCLAELF